MRLIDFFSWYYTEGIRSAFWNAVNLPRFLFRYFNVVELSLTLVSPWKHDVTYRSWRGFHPLRAAKVLTFNLVARFMGMILRLPVIVFGFLFTLTAIVLVIPLFLWYASAPVIFVAAALLLALQSPYDHLALVFGASGVLFGLFGFLLRTPDPVDAFDFSLLRHATWFPRLLARLGIERRQISREAFEDFRLFLTELNALNISKTLFETAAFVERRASLARARRARFWLWENLVAHMPIGSGWRFAYTPQLDRYSLDLSKRDRTEYRGLELIGREAELRVATIILERPVQNGIFLVGEPGIGKTMFVHHLASLIRHQVFPRGSVLNNLRVLVFDIEAAIGAALVRGQNYEEYLRYLFLEASYAGNILLVIKDIDLFLGAVPDKPNVAHLISEFLTYPSFRLIGTAVASRYHSLVKHDEQIVKLFETIYVRQPSLEENRDILLQSYDHIERRRVLFTLRGIEAIIGASRRYNWEMPYPERVLDLAQQIVIYFRGIKERLIDVGVVNSYVSMKTGIPTGDITDQEKEKLLNLEDALHERVIGQNEAVNQVAQVLRKSRAGFHDPRRPLGSFLFMGPTGVGKTETVKALAASIFGDDDRMVRLDMSEFQNANALDRLIGSQTENITGVLVKAMKEHPYSLLLLDEIEKAYPKVLDLFLQILDEGMLTDGYGEKISFRSTIIIATSNAGSVLIKNLSAEGLPLNVVRQKVLDQVVEEGVFRIEFLNRFDNIIFFEPLSGVQITDVIRLKLKKFAEAMKEEKNIELSFEDGLAERIAEIGYEPEFGARSINRFIQDRIEDVVIRKIIAGTIQTGGALVIGPQDLA